MELHIALMIHSFPRLDFHYYVVIKYLTKNFFRGKNVYSTHKFRLQLIIAGKSQGLKQSVTSTVNNEEKWVCAYSTPLLCSALFSIHTSQDLLCLRNDATHSGLNLSAPINLRQCLQTFLRANQILALSKALFCGDPRLC